MGIADVPAKIIERTESLTENKLQVAAELTKLIYATSKEPITQEQVLKTYMECYQRIKDLTPPPIEKLSRSKLNYISIGVGVLIAMLAAGYFFLKGSLGF